MKRVLLAYDGSPCADDAFQDLAQAGLGEEVEAMVISVADVWLPSNPSSADPVLPPSASPAVRQAREQAKQALRSAQALAERSAERLRAQFPKWTVSAWACADSPAWGILNKATTWKANLVILGSHGRSTLERLFLGSVSQKVAAEAVCSVHISRPRRRRHHERQRIAVAVDGSPDSLVAVREVGRRRWSPPAEARVVTVLDSRLETAIAWPELYGSEWVHERDTAAREAVLRMLEGSARTLQAAGLLAETQLLTGDPKKELLKDADAWEADVIFIGARGLQHADRLALGTMASAVAARAHCSVEIVRPD